MRRVRTRDTRAPQHAHAPRQADGDVLGFLFEVPNGNGPTEMAMNRLSPASLQPLVRIRVFLKPIVSQRGSDSEVIHRLEARIGQADSAMSRVGSTAGDAPSSLARSVTTAPHAARASKGKRDVW